MGKDKDKVSDSHGVYYFKLFVAGDEPNSRKAKESLMRICENYLREKYVIEVIDVHKDYKSALENNILLAPTLVIIAPQGETKIIGSLNDERKILEVLGLSEGEEKG